MRALAVIHAVAHRGQTHAARLRSEAPLLARTTAGGGGALAIHLVGGAAGPLGGDDLRTEIDLADGARVVVRSVAASMAQPSPHGTASTSTIRGRVAAGAVLDWRPEPLISVGGSDHRIDTRLDVAATAQLVWLDEIVLGRHGEQPGRVTSRLRVSVDDEVALDHEIVAGSGALRGAGANGSFRVLASAVVLGQPQPSRSPIITPTCRAAALACAGRATLFSGVASTRDELAAAFAALGLREPAKLTAARRRAVVAHPIR